jgi:hypothetical protein
MRALHPLRLCVAILGLSLVLAVLACLLPDNAYQRWQLLDGTIHANARWIYERTEFDPRPIDVAFIGPSRTGAGVNAPRLSAALAARGLPANVVNFSLPEAGRNINYVIAEQLLRHKTPKLLVLGVTEKPSRFGHSAFKFIAPREMIVAPGYWFDFNYFSDLIYLPYRQLRLFFEDVAPDLFGGDKHFSAADYRGRSIDTTGSLTLPGGVHKEGDLPASARELARGVHKLEAGEHPPILPGRYADVEFGDERYYIRRIADLARAKGVKVAFLSLPYYTGPSTLQEFDFYRKFGPVWNAGYLSPHAEWYADYGHLDRTGAEHLTDWLVPRVAADLTAPTPIRRPTP